MVNDSLDRRSDYERLMDLAMWLDIYDAERAVKGQNEIQKDLRRIARRLLKLDGKRSFTRGDAA